MRKSKAMLALTSRYATLVTDLTLRPSSGLITLYALRAGSGIVTADRELIANQLGLLGSQREVELVRFANACVAENILNYCTLLGRVISRSVQIRRQDMREHPRLGEQPPVNLSAATFEALARVKARVDRGLDRVRSENDLPDDAMQALALSAMDDAVAQVPGYGLKNQEQRLLEGCAGLCDMLSYHTGLAESVQKYHVPTLKAMLAIAHVYQEISPLTMRAPGPLPLRLPAISNSTVAALPLPNRELIELCQEPESGMLSQAAQDYLHSLSKFTGQSPL